MAVRPLCTELRPPFVRRGRGRPRKHAPPGPPFSENKNTSLAEKISEGEQTEPVEETTEMISVKTPQTDIRSVCKPENKPVPVKRGRGRPPKKKRGQVGCRAAAAGAEPKSTTPINRSPGTQTESSPSKSSQPVSSPVRQPHGFKSPNIKPKDSPPENVLLGDGSALRPLTRGALGKDFPSAKKRSWIDVEKELELEQESE